MGRDGRLTGSTFISEETIGKQLELLKEVVPRVSRIGVVVNPRNPVFGLLLKATEARALGLNLTVGVQRAEDLESAFRGLIHAHLGGLVVMRDAGLLTNQARLLALAANNVMYGMREFVVSGDWMSYGPRTAG